MEDENFKNQTKHRKTWKMVFPQWVGGKDGQLESGEEKSKISKSARKHTGEKGEKHMSG